MSSSNAGWKCRECGTINKSNATNCSICMTNRPHDAPTINEADLAIFGFDSNSPKMMNTTEATDVVFNVGTNGDENTADRRKKKNNALKPTKQANKPKAKAKSVNHKPTMQVAKKAAANKPKAKAKSVNHKPTKQVAKKAAANKSAKPDAVFVSTKRDRDDDGSKNLAMMPKKKQAKTNDSSLTTGLGDAMVLSNEAMNCNRDGKENVENASSNNPKHAAKKSATVVTRAINPALSFLFDPAVEVNSYTLDELMTKDVQELIKKQQIDFMECQLYQIESAANRVVKPQGRTMYAQLMKAGGGILRRLMFYACHKKFQDFISFYPGGGFVFKEGIGIKLFASILGYNDPSPLITNLAKYGFSRHPDNPNARTSDDGGAVYWRKQFIFINADVVMGADVSEIVMDKKRKKMPAAVLKDALTAVQDEIQSKLDLISSYGKKQTKDVKAAKKRLLTDIVVRLKTLNDSDTEKLLNRLKGGQVCCIYDHLSKCGKVLRQKKPQVTALVRLTGQEKL